MEPRSGEDAPHDGNEGNLSHLLDRGDGENRAHDYENEGEGIAAHHPFAMLLDPPHANTIERRSCGYYPTDGLCRGGHHHTDGPSIIDVTGWARIYKPATPDNVIGSFLCLQTLIP